MKKKTWSAARRKKFAATVAAKQASKSTPANGRGLTSSEAGKRLRAMGEALVAIGTALEPLSTSEAAEVMRGVSERLS